MVDRLGEFIKYNAKSLVRILEALEVDPRLVGQAKKDAGVLFKNKELIYKAIENIKNPEDYVLKESHLINAQDDLLKNPSKKALKGLDEFLSEELSIEPQVGKIVGAAYGKNINAGLLVPINTNLIFRSDTGEDIIVTGVTKGSALQEVDATEMTTQSAREALTLNLHYFQNLFSENENLKHIDASRIVGNLLKSKSIHHQIESVNYMGGGPSAGFALSINTLSVLLDIPVYHDFGITGAPGTRGVSKGKAGSSVMIGGEDKKSERILMDLRRMYVPKKNYHTISTDLHKTYWDEGKLIIPVSDYSDIIPEVLYLGKSSDKLLQELIKSRIDYNKKSLFVPEDELKKEKTKISNLENSLKETAEFVIISRLIALNNFYNDNRKNEFASLEYIFEKYDPTIKSNCNS